MRSLFLAASLLCFAGLTGSLDRAHAADNIPPALIFNQPQDGETGVISLFPLVLLFDEPMAPTASIGWSANINSGLVSLSWPDDTTLLVTYAPGWPANATVSWVLNPTAGQASNFKDAAGNPLPSGEFRGTFSTGTGGGGDPGSTNNPCASPGEVDRNGSVSIFKNSNWVQTNSGSPVPASTSTAGFFASVSPPANGLVTSASVQIPSGVTRTFTNLFGSDFIFFQQFPSEAALEAAYPAGNYLLSILGGNPVPSTIVMPANAFPTLPHVTNFDAAQSIDPNQDFTLRWDPFAGAGVNENIILSISENGRTIFTAPDLCIPRELPSTATSVVIPKGTFVAGRVYTGTLTFSRLAFKASSVFPGASGGAGLSRVTEFSLKAAGSGGPGGGGPRFASIIRKEDGLVEMVIQGQPGSTLTVERSTNLSNWTTLQPVFIPAAGSAVVVDVSTGVPSMAFYRARVN